MMILLLPFVTIAWSILASGREEASRLGFLAGLLVLYATVHGLIAGWCAMTAITGLRAAYLGRQARQRETPPPPKTPDASSSVNDSGINPRPQYSSRPLSYELERRSVGNHPMLWKEMGVRILQGVGVGRVGGAVFLMGALILATVSHSRSTGQNFAEVVNPLMRGSSVFLMCLSLFFMAMNASGRIAREREQHTLEPLFTTPLDNLDILGAKWLANIISARPFWYFLLVIWGPSLLTGALNPFALLLVLAGYGVLSACLATMGLWFSLFSRTTLRATLFTMLGAIVLIIGPGFFATMFGLDRASGSFTWDALLAEHALTPSVTLWTLSFHTGELSTDDPLPFLKICAAIFGLHLYLLLTVVMWVSLLTRLRAEVR